LWLGLTFVALGIMPMLATFDLGLLGADDINGPPWLGLASGGVFMAGGLAVIAGPDRPVINSILVILVLGGLAAIGNWIAFGVGERVCGGSILIWSGGQSGLGCRIPFGFGALVANAVLLLIMVVAIQSALGGPPRLARLRSLAENLTLLALAPILLPLLIILFFGIGTQAVRTRISTGRWPRNEAFIARIKAGRTRNQEAE
jgi:hypothetical protein